MSAFHRSGKPEHINGSTANNSLEMWPITGGPTMRLTIINTGAQAIEVFLTLAAANAGAGAGVEIATSGERTFETETKQFWTISTGGASSFRAVATCRT